MTLWKRTKITWKCGIQTQIFNRKTSFPTVRPALTQRQCPSACMIRWFELTSGKFVAPTSFHSSKPLWSVLAFSLSTHIYFFPTHLWTNPFKRNHSSPWVSQTFLHHPILVHCEKCVWLNSWYPNQPSPMFRVIWVGTELSTSRRSGVILTEEKCKVGSE